MPDNTYTIEYLRGANFVPVELNRDNVNTIEHLRNYMEIETRAVISVRGSDDAAAIERDDSYVLQAGDKVASVVTSKTGG
jgi:hypothetical protein